MGNTMLQNGFCRSCLEICRLICFIVERNIATKAYFSLQTRDVF